MEYLSEIISFVAGVIGGSTLTFFRMSRTSRDAVSTGSGTAVNMRDATATGDNIIGSSVDSKS